MKFTYGVGPFKFTGIAYLSLYMRVTTQPYSDLLLGDITSRHFKSFMHSISYVNMKKSKM